MIKSKWLKIGLYNAGSLGTHHDDFTISVGNQSPDILAINETWLRKGEEGRAPVLPGYRLRHVPRSCRVRSRGGGVGFYINNSLSVRTCPHSQSINDVEQMWVTITINHKKLLVGTAYRPPWQNVERFLDGLTNSISSFSNYDHLVLLGDFNINILDIQCTSVKCLKQFMSCFSLSNFVNQPTHFTAHSQTLLDLICSDLTPVHDITHHKISDKGHDMVIAKFKFRQERPLPRRISFRPIKEINLTKLNNDLLFTDFNILHSFDNINRMVTTFNNYILELFNKHAPEKSIVVRNREIPWHNNNLKHLMHLRDKAYENYRRSKSSTRKEYYKSLKHAVIVTLHSEKQAYFTHHINNNIKRPRTLWKNLKDSVLPDFKNKTNLPDNFNDPDKINSHFLDIPGNTNDCPSEIKHFENNKHTDTMFVLEPVSSNVVAKAILSIKSNAQGVDKITMDMIVMTLPETLDTITTLVNKSITSSTFPDIWKVAVVRPIPKNSAPVDVKDLRAISILPFLSKICEKIVYDQMVRYLESNKILPDHQSGFRKGRSTATALLDVVDNILLNRDLGSSSILVLLDFSRAFDCLNTNLLLAKLHYYGFSSSTVAWFRSYLSNRFQQVEITKQDGSKHTSRLRPVPRGVPQGSILGPLLYIIYSSDIIKCLQHCNYHLYADDLQIYTSVGDNDFDQKIKNINEDLDRISAWSVRNSLVPNPTKSKYIIFGSQNQIRRTVSHNPMIMMDNVPIERVSETRNLGLLIDGELRFETHVAEIARNCFYRLKVLYNLRPFISEALRISLCDSLILSRFNYCIQVYGPCLYRKTHQVIQRVQNACARFCFNIPPRTHVTPYLNRANLLKMEKRQDLYLATLLFGVINTQAPDYLYTKLKWRERHVREVSVPLHCPHHRTAAFKGSFRYSATKCWNNLPPPLRACTSKYSFKSQYRIIVLKEQNDEFRT